MDITPYLKLMVEKNASDLFFTVGSPVKIKLEGKASPVGKTVLTSDLCRSAAFGIMNDHQVHHFEEHMECDFAIAMPDGSGRFRVNVFRQRGEVGMVLRLIPSKIPTFDQLGVPEVLKELIMHKRGLILMVGATGSGKSTTLAAMINHRNENMAGHILTIEDPVEFSHPNLKSIVNQREVGVDTLTYRNALKSSLREAPDVILIGEIRDQETMQAAIDLAGTGHLAIATLHANNAPETLDRIINMYPNEQHAQVFMDLGQYIRAIISQRLVRSKEGERVAAVELMVNTAHIAELIHKGDIAGVKEAFKQTNEPGMQGFDGALLRLYSSGQISMDEALANADSRADLEAKINFG